MPQRKLVEKLEELCSSNVANYVLSRVSSWYQDTICSREANITGNISSDQNYKKLQEYLKKKSPARIREQILEKTLNRISQSIYIPQWDNGAEHIDYVNFLNQLAFFLQYALKCLFTNGITYLDLSPIAHLIRKWKLSFDVYVWNFKLYRRLSFTNENTNLHHPYHGNKNDYKNLHNPYHDIFTCALNNSDLSLKTLKYLKLPHFVHDEFVSIVATHCTELEYLILNCSPDCSNPKGSVNDIHVLQHLYGQNVSPKTDDHIETNVDYQLSPPGCKKLKMLILPEGVELYDDISDHGEDMLACMKDLEYLVGVPMVYLSYVYDSLLNPEQNELSQKMCKKIERIKLQNFHHGAYNIDLSFMFVYKDDQRMEISDLPFSPKNLSIFRDVNEISIHTSAEITEVVLKAFPHVQNVTLFTEEYSIHGPYLNNLVKLNINITCEEEWPILYHLSIVSPKLEHLTLKSYSLQVDNNSHGNIETSIKFPELKTLKLYGQYIIKQNAFYKLLSGCPSLTSLYIKMLKEQDIEIFLNDAVLVSVIPLLPNLQKFYFKLQYGSIRRKVLPRITIVTLNALVESCPQLSSIGELDSWDVTGEILNHFYLKCKENNWDLEIN